MLIGNYSILTKTCGRSFAGSKVSDTRAKWSKSAGLRGFLLSRPYASLPLGCTSPTAWALATKSGGIASFTGAKGTGNLANLNLAGGLNGTAALTGTGDITNAGIVYIIVASAALTGNGAIAAAIKGALSLESNLVGAGALSSDLIGALSATASLTGSGDLSGDLAGALQAVANLLGSGSVSAEVSGSIQMISNLSGNGDLTLASATMIWNMLSDLAGSSSVTASVIALGNTIAALQGNGELAGSPRATAGVSSDITVTGDLLTTSNVGESVWNVLASLNNESGTMGELLNNSGAGGNPWDTAIDGTYTAADVMRIVAAALAGKATGGGTTSIALRDLSDTKNVVTMMVDVNGNRSSVVLNP